MTFSEFEVKRYERATQNYINANRPPAIVPRLADNTNADATRHAHGALARMSWSRLRKRVFDIDIEHCPKCGGRLKIIAAIEDPVVIVSILTHLGLPARAPPRSPARRVDLFQEA